LVLRETNWPFATRFVALALIEEDPEEVNGEWDFSYRYPTDALKVRRIQSGIRNDTRQSRVPYRLGNDDSGQLIYTDMEDAVAEYTKKITEEARFPPDFVMAMSLRLAGYIAPALTAGDPYDLSKKCFQKYLMEYSIAEANSSNEEQAEENPQSEFISGRD
jgi:hypothetical protein